MTDSLPKLREQLRDLKQMNASGQLDNAAFASARAALEAQLLDNMLATPAAPPAKRRGLVWAGAAVLVALVVVAVAWKI